MSREPMAGEENWWADLADRVRERYQEFREGRLYVQVMLTLGLVCASGLAALFPVGPLARVHAGLAWTATHDYDFAGQAAAARSWAAERGGWKAALTGSLESGAERVKRWAAPLLPLPKADTDTAEEPSAADAGDADADADPETSAGEAPAAEEPAKPALTGKWVMPVDGSVMNPFGWTTAEGKERYHDGVDVLALRGSAVVAVADGVVVKVAHDAKAGHHVEIEHGELRVLYAQLEAVKVKVGDRLKQGARIGAVGNPVGDHRHLSPHLHLEVRPRESENAVDPIPYLPLGGKQI